MRLAPPVDEPTLERVYAAGVDNVDFYLSEGPKAILPESIQRVFPRWGVAATLILGTEDAACTIDKIDRLLQAGIVPMVEVSSRGSIFSTEKVITVLEYLASGWEKSSVPLQAYLPLISAMTPLVQEKPAGIFRGIVDRLCDRHQLVGSDLRRHLRVQQTENSLDSAGL